MSTINPHKLGVHKILKHIPLNAIFDIPSKRRLAKAVNIADLRLCAKARAHKVSVCDEQFFCFSIIKSCPFDWMAFCDYAIQICHVIVSRRRVIVKPSRG